jgi:hypothetical protein
MATSGQWQGLLLYAWHKRAARKVASHFEYLENRPRGISRSTDVTWQPVRGSSQPFRISREPVAWPWCNLAASQRKPYCASVNSHCPVGLVGRQWDVVDWVCVLWDCRIHNDRPSVSASSRQCAYPFYNSRAGFLGQSLTSPRSVGPPTAQIWLPATSGFSQS